MDAIARRLHTAATASTNTNNTSPSATAAFCSPLARRWLTHLITSQGPSVVRMHALVPVGMATSRCGGCRIAWLSMASAVMTGPPLCTSHHLHITCTPPRRRPWLDRVAAPAAPAAERARQSSACHNLRRPQRRRHAQRYRAPFWQRRARVCVCMARHVTRRLQLIFGVSAYEVQVSLVCRGINRSDMSEGQHPPREASQPRAPELRRGGDLS